MLLTPVVGVVIGTRPEAIKLAPILWECARPTARLRARTIVTGQHDGLLRESMRELGIQADVNLGLMRRGQSLPTLTSRVIERLGAELEASRPSLLIVQGDTASACGAALCAFLLRIPVVHVEAGLRTYRLDAPFPEEGSRQLISRIATLHFAPTPRAASRLLSEGVPPERVHVTGNTVVDALQEMARRVPPISRDPSQKLILLTAHRRENLGAPIARIFQAVQDLAHRYPNLRFVFPVHPNPGVCDVARQRFNGNSQIDLVDPLPYGRLVQMLRLVDLVMTDSGGLQEEAPVFGKPVLVLRDETERPEAIEWGSAQLVGTDRQGIVAAVTSLLEDHEAYTRMARAGSPFGDGKAAPRIIKVIERFLGIVPPSDRARGTRSPSRGLGHLHPR